MQFLFFLYYVLNERVWQAFRVVLACLGFLKLYAKKLVYITLDTQDKLCLSAQKQVRNRLCLEHLMCCCPPYWQKLQKQNWFIYTFAEAYLLTEVNKILKNLANIFQNTANFLFSGYSTTFHRRGS